MFHPALSAGRRIVRSRVDNSKLLIEAIDFAAKEGKEKNKIRKISVKPGGDVSAYYQISTPGGPYFIVFYKDGSVAAKLAADENWTRFKSQGDLVGLYKEIDEELSTGIAYKVEGFKLQDFEPIIMKAPSVPGTLDKVKPK